MADIPVYENDAETEVVITSNGQSSISYDFLILRAEQMAVYYTPLSTGVPTKLVYDIDYTVAGANNPNGGTVTLLTVATVAGDKFLQRRETPIERLKDWQNEGDYKADLVNYEQDEIYMIMQENRRGLRENASSISAETAARIAGDNALSDRIDGMEGVVNDAAGRAEDAAGRAEDAAGRAEDDSNSAAASALYASDAADRAEGFAAMQSADKIKFKIVLFLLADTSMSYDDEPGKVQVGPGDAIEAQGFRYEVAASNAMDWHVETTGGVRLKVLPTNGAVFPQQFGALATGASDGSGDDDSDFIQAANDAARLLGVKCVAYGGYRIDSKVVLNSAFDGTAATFFATGDATSTIAVEVSTGNGENPTDILTLTRDGSIILPDVINTAKTAPGWNGFGIGVRYVNVQNMKIVERLIENFAIGAQQTAFSNGCGYNAVQAGYLRNNKVNRQIINGDIGAWVNRWDYFGGRYFHSSTEGVETEGVMHVDVVPNATGLIINDHQFFGGSFEGTAEEYHARLGGNYINFWGGRWESSAGIKIHLEGAGIEGQGRSNGIFRGRGAHATTVRVTHGGILSTTPTFTIESNSRESYRKASGPEVHTSSGGASVPTHVIVETLSDFNDDIDVAYALSISATAMRMKRGADTHDRLMLDGQNGRIFIGSGSSDPTVGISPVGSNGMRLRGNLYIDNIGVAPGPIAGVAALWFDGTDLKFRLPDGTIKTVTAT